jgi:hypothetical protein
MAVASFAMTIPAGTAHAGTTSCGSDATHIASDYPVRETDLQGRHIALYNGRVFDDSYAMITSGYRSGDRVWVDRRAPGSSSWFQCGPFNSNMSNEMDNIGWEMRACADVLVNGSRQHACTGWYLDKD